MYFFTSYCMNVLQFMYKRTPQTSESRFLFDSAILERLKRRFFEDHDLGFTTISWTCCVYLNKGFHTAVICILVASHKQQFFLCEVK